MPGREAAREGCDSAVGGHPRDRALDGEEQDEGHDEDQPARELVEEALSGLGAHVVRGHPGTRDPEAVGRDGHRDGGQRQRDARPGAAVHQVPVDDGQREQRDQRADSAARLGHLEARVAQRDHVPLAQHRHAGDRERQLAEPGREELQREGDLVEDDGRDRDHQQQERQRKEENPQRLPAVEEQDRAGQDAQHRDPHQEQLGAQDARAQDRDAQDHEDQAEG